MNKISNSLKSAVGGGLKSPPLRRKFEIYSLKNLTNYQEYITNEYCLVCSNFINDKGHFGHCKDMPNKIFDGAKKNCACGLWRLNKLYYNNGIKQVLPEVSTLKYNFKKCRVRPKDLMRQWHKPRRTIPCRAVKCRICGSVFTWNIRRKSQDLCKIHAVSVRLIKYHGKISQNSMIRLKDNNNIVKPEPTDYCI